MATRNRVVFYIRALFHQSLMPGSDKNGSPDVRKLVEYFNQFSRISAQEYRQQIHQIQRENLSAISRRMIYNNPQHNPKRRFNYTYAILQPNTLARLAELNDDDIVIPLDDDDWISPALANYEFDSRALCYWHTASFPCANRRVRVMYHAKCQPLPAKLSSPAEIEEARGLLSNCQSVPGWIIKRLLEMKRIDVLQQLLQRHSRMRALVREEPIVTWNVSENIFDAVLSVYVRHAANVTLFNRVSRFGEEDAFNSDSYEQIVGPFRDAQHDVAELPADLKWASPYLRSLEELNAQL